MHDKYSINSELDVRVRNLLPHKFNSNILLPHSLDFKANMVETLAEEMVFSLAAFIYGENLGRHIVKQPDGWFQAFKEEKFPQWVLKKFPVKYKVTILEAKALYPNFEPIRGHQPVYQFHEMKSIYIDDK